MRLLNSKTYEEKEYSIDDVRGFITNESKGLPVGFYGGRADKLGKTAVNGLYLCMEGMEVIDLIVDDDEMIDIADFEAELEGFEENLPKESLPFEAEEDLSEKTNNELIEMLIEKGAEVPERATKAELIKLLSKEDLDE